MENNKDKPDERLFPEADPFRRITGREIADVLPDLPVGVALGKSNGQPCECTDHLPS